jgi:hypothetical protein
VNLHQSQLQRQSKDLKIIGLNYSKMQTDNSKKFRRRIRSYIRRMSHLVDNLSSQIDELAGECNQLKRNIRKKMIQRKQLVNVYKQNLSLRADNRKLVEDLYLAKNMLSKKNLAIFLKETTSSSSPKHGD